MATTKLSEIQNAHHVVPSRLETTGRERKGSELPGDCHRRRRAVCRLHTLYSSNQHIRSRLDGPTTEVEVVSVHSWLAPDPRYDREVHHFALMIPQFGSLRPLS